MVQLKLVQGVTPSTGGLFVRLFLGQVNVRVSQRKDKLKLRDEYNKFKSRANYGVHVRMFVMFVTWRCCRISGCCRATLHGFVRARVSSQFFF